MSIPGVVFDCMIFTQAMISPRGPAAACIEHIRKQNLKLYWSDYVLQEIRELPGKLPARLAVTPERVEAFILEFAPYVEHVAVVPEVFINPFDRDDSHYINLAVATGAKLIASRDGDLIRLMDQSRPEAREFRTRFPDLQVVTPEALLAHLKQAPES